MCATWCCLQEESPAWLLTTGNMRDAEVAILTAAQLNGVDMKKAKSTLTVIMTQLGKLDRSQSSTTTVSAVEGIIETVKMRRRAVSVFIARFTLSAVYFGVLVRDRATALRWHVAHVFLSTAYYAATYWAMTKWGLCDTLAALLVVVCSCALAEAAVISRDYNPAIPFVYAGMKVAVSAALGVVLCYVGDIFPTHIRSIGVSLSIFFGGAGTQSSVSLITLTGRNANAAFSMFAAFTTLLSIGVVHWLPEVFIEKPKKAAPIRVLTEMERKQALKNSLSFFAARKKEKSH
ncbi:carcinine transporter-like [Amblyomma americanum]